jgi:hypothetical protein
MGVIHRGSEGGVGAAVVPDESKTLKAEMLHQCHAIARLGALGRTAVIGRVGGLRGLAEAAQVRANDRV